MNSTTIVLLVLGIVIVAGGISFLLYKAGFSVTKLKVKLGLMEAEAERRPAPADTSPSETTMAARTEARQTATRGSTIRQSSQEAPANAGARLIQEADDHSEIDNSHIKLDSSK